MLIDPEKPELGEKRLTRGGFTDLEEAQAALTEALRKKARNEKFQGKTPTVGVYVEHWVTSLRLADSTIKGYRKIIRNHITPDLGRIRIDKLTATRIGSHYRELEKSGRKDEYGKGKPLSANSIHKVHVVLGAILDAAIDDGLIQVNPAKKKRTVNAPKSSQVRAQKPEIVTWTGEQLQAFLTWNEQELKDELFPLWRLIAYTGMRRSEALALRWNDINTRTGRVSIRRAVNTEDWTTTKTTKTGNARVTIKGLRHTHATLLLELGEHPKVVQERLGHSTITTTMNIYSHVTPTMQRSAVEGFASHISGA